MLHLFFFVLLSIIVVGVNGIDEKHLDADENVKWFIKPQFDDVWYFSEGLARVRKKWKYGFTNKEGQIVIPPQFDSTWSFSEGLAAVKKYEKCEFIAHPTLFSRDLAK